MNLTTRLRVTRTFAFLVLLFFGAVMANTDTQEVIRSDNVTPIEAVALVSVIVRAAEDNPGDLLAWRAPNYLFEDKQGVQFGKCEADEETCSAGESTWCCPVGQCDTDNEGCLDSSPPGR